MWHDDNFYMLKQLSYIAYGCIPLEVLLGLWQWRWTYPSLPWVIYIILECVANILLFEPSSHYGIGPPFSFGPISSGVYQQSCKSSDKEYYHINWAVVKSKFYLVVSLNWKMREGELLDLSHSIWWSCLFFLTPLPHWSWGIKGRPPLQRHGFDVRCDSPHQSLGDSSLTYDF